MPATGSFQLAEAVVERLDGAPVGERRRWSGEFKAQAVTAALDPGVNVSALARHLGIFPSQLFGWRKAFLNKQGESDPGGPRAPLVEIMEDDVMIRVSPDLSEAVLRRILRAVRSA